MPLPLFLAVLTVLQSMSNGSFDLAWAAILIGAMAAIVGYLVVSLIERVAIPWAIVAET